jgi:predicted house-cleaning noncanonical NTP pyrophosphatase (MazG superfamily)
MKKTKLVRDNIPDLIRKNVGTPRIVKGPKNAADQAYALIGKIDEEKAELLQARLQKSYRGTIEEISDLLQILVSLCDHLGITWEEVEKARQQKEEDLGTFTQFHHLEL